MSATTKPIIGGKSMMSSDIVKERLVADLCEAAGYVKLVCSIGNNAAHMAMLDGYDHARQCKAYRHEVKRTFKAAIDEWHDYEKRLLYNRDFRMFCVADMPENVRRKYGDITDHEYYDYWAATGCSAYEKTRPLLTSLQNKYKKSLVRHGYKDANHVAWAMVAMACLELACVMHERALTDCPENYHIPIKVARLVFGQFSLLNVKEKWNKALKMLTGAYEHPLDSDEERDISLGLEQLTDAWIDSSLHFQSLQDTVEDYDEVFRSKGMQKKIMRECAEARAIDH